MDYEIKIGVPRIGGIPITHLKPGMVVKVEATRAAAYRTADELVIVHPITVWALITAVRDVPTQ